MEHKLVFTAHGTVQLQTARGAVRWNSDEDEEFRDEFTDEFLDPDEDEEDIVDYLLEHGFMQDGDDIEIIEEDLEDFDEEASDEDIEDDDD